jgi:hypothetical protein
VVAVAGDGPSPGGEKGRLRAVEGTKTDNTCFFKWSDFAVCVHGDLTF